MTGTAELYLRFGEIEAKGSSPSYSRLALAVAGSDELLGWLSDLPRAKRQPNLLFAAVRFVGGPTGSASEFATFVRSNANEIAATMLSRSTQTNEAARCGAFLPQLAALDGEIALIEVGASAGLCLIPDLYSYTYDGVPLGNSEVRIDVDTANTISAPRRLPTVIWRRGIDLNPLDASNPDHLAWLQACIWPEHGDRRRRLDLAAAIAAENPVVVVKGDLRTSTVELINSAPSNAIKVIFHSAVLAYVDQRGRHEFAATMKSIVEVRDDVIWLSNEAPLVIPGLAARGFKADTATPQSRFLLGRNGTEALAHTDPHGHWIRRLGERHHPY